MSYWESEKDIVLRKMEHCPTCNIRVTTVTNTITKDMQCDNGHRYWFNYKNNTIVVGEPSRSFLATNDQETKQPIDITNYIRGC